MTFASIPQALHALQQGKFIIVVDDENRENEGDFIMAGEFASAESINFMLHYGRGLICAPLSNQRADALALPLMMEPNDNTARNGTSFTISVGAKHGTTTGISAADRARTVQTLADPASQPEDLSRPGHIFPLRGHPNGLEARQGHTEATLELLELAGLQPAGVLCEILNDDGTMARLPQLEVVAAQHGLLIINIADLMRYRQQLGKRLTTSQSVWLPTDEGEFRARGYEDKRNGAVHVALYLGELETSTATDKIPLVRVHSECLTGDVFGSQRCDCGPQFAEAKRLIQAEGLGVILYLRQEGRGIGLMNKLRAYSLQEQGLDTVEANHALGLDADLRDYSIAAEMLADLGIRKIRLMTNNPAKINALTRYGIEIAERVPLVVGKTHANHNYLHVKKEKMGHILP